MGTLLGHQGDHLQLILTFLRQYVGHVLNSLEIYFQEQILLQCCRESTLSPLLHICNFPNLLLSRRDPASRHNDRKAVLCQQFVVL